MALRGSAGLAALVTWGALACDPSPATAPAGKAPSPEAPLEVVEPPAVGLDAALREADAVEDRLLARQPVPDADAGPRAQLGAEGRLPAAKGGGALDDATPLVVLRPNLLVFGGKALLRLTDLELTPRGFEDGVFVPLRDGISDAPGGAPRIVADATVRFEWLAAIVHTLHAAGRRTQALVVDGGDELRTFDIRQPDVEGPKLRVSVLADGYRVARSDSKDPRGRQHDGPPMTPLTRPGAPIDELDRWNVAKLADDIKGVKALFPSETAVSVAADREVPVGAVVAAMEVLRGEGCTPDTPNACHFPEIHLQTTPVDAVVEPVGGPVVEPVVEPEVETVATSEPGSVRVSARGAVRAARPTVEGDLEFREVRRVVRKAMPQLDTCYDDGLADDPNVEGRVAITFEVGRAGKVTSASVDTASAKAKSIATCFATVLRTLEFPTSGSGTVTYPFSLSSR
ncbi:MAG: AgmX/PglI C-terminal domain-containing protein [Myxococcota bacterium]